MSTPDTPTPDQHSTDPRGTDLLARELRRRADAVGAGSARLDLPAVASRARSLRRRRRSAAAALVAAAVVAVALPLGLRDTERPRVERVVDPAGSPGAPSGGPTAADPGRPVPLGLDAPQGAPPSLPVETVADRVLLASGGRYDLPTVLPQVVPYDDGSVSGWLALRPTEEGMDVVRYSGDFTGMTVTRSGLVRPSIVTTPDGATVAWTQREGEGEDGENLLLVDGYRTPLPQATDRAVGFLADGRVVVAGTDPGDDGAGPGAYAVVEVPGREVRGADSPFQAVDGAGGDVVVGQTSYDDTTGETCSGAQRPLAGEALLWETCDWSLGAVSPDGQHVVGLTNDTTSDGPGSPRLAVLDATTGAVERTFVVPTGSGGSGVGQVVWEDDATLLLTLDVDGREGVLRAGLDGGVEQALAPVAGSPVDTDVWLTTAPYGA